MEDHVSLQEESTHPIQVYRYDASQKNRWDHFVEKAKNGFFFFKRDFLEYYAQRFEDHSLIFMKEDKVVGLFPLHRHGSIVESHGGVPFAGIITSTSLKTPMMVDIFSSLITFLRQEKMEMLIYKPIPHIFHRIPAEEDLYALFLNKAVLTNRHVSSVIFLPAKIPFSRLRMRSLNKTRDLGLVASESKNFEKFMDLRDAYIEERFQAKPSHTASELAFLANQFPENVKLFTVTRNTELLMGVVLYENDQVVHAQYSGNSAEGLELYALDVLYEYLIHDRYRDKKYFSFGRSSLAGGRESNPGNLTFKEGFGARTVVWDTYELRV